jgi:hypothetical protein
LSVSALLLTFLVSKDLGREKQQQGKSDIVMEDNNSNEESQPLTLYNEIDDFLEENTAK